MKAFYVLLISLLIVFNSCHYEDSSQAQDSEQMVMATLWFQRSAEARALFYQAYNLATLKVKMALDTLPPDLPKAVITDIDETILDNSPSEGKNILEGERFSSARWKNWTDKREAQPLSGSLDFANFLASSGVDLYYISNRSEDELESTIDNLKKLGYPFADKDHVLLKSDTSVKTARREKVSKENFVILLMGDNLADFTELFDNRNDDFGFSTTDLLKAEFGHRFIVFPNPMYGSWTKPIYGNDKKLNPEEIAARRKSFITGY